jgi:hypothetical protein
MSDRLPKAAYRVGKLLDGVLRSGENGRFETRKDAVAAAFDGAKDKEVWAVWFNDSVIVIVCDGQSYT